MGSVRFIILTENLMMDILQLLSMRVMMSVLQNTNGEISFGGESLGTGRI